jgi:hypothetical protein
MLAAWGHDIFKSIESGTWVRLILLALMMICVVWVTFRTELKKPPGG